eukprot:PITA_17285
MVDEMAYLHKNEAWDLVELPGGRKPIGSIWVFKKKTNAKGKVEKYKARLVAKGYSQVSGIDFGDIFSPISKVASIRLLLSVVANFDFEKFDTFIWGLSFTRSKADHCVYFKLIGDRVIYMVLHVDDMLLVGNDKEIIQDLKTHLSSKFDMKDLGVVNYILGMEIKRDWIKRKLWLNQRKYVETILQRFNMQDSKPMKVPIPVGVKLSAEQCPKTQEEEEDMSHAPYASAVGSVMYATVCTKPDIAHEVGVLSRFMSKPRKERWTTVKRVFKYLCGTSDYHLCYHGRPGLDRVLDIHVFVDADWAGDLDQRRSTSGYVFNLFGGAVSWMIKKQRVVVLSTTKAEYMAATHASKETVWL